MAKVPLQAADSSGQTVNFVSRLKCRQTRAGLFDDAGQIHSENGREVDASMLRLAASDFRVKWIYTACLDANEHLAAAGFRKRNFGESERSAMTLQDEGAHKC